MQRRSFAVNDLPDLNGLIAPAKFQPMHLAYDAVARAAKLFRDLSGGLALLP
jgi:hypothetical protein